MGRVMKAMPIVVLCALILVAPSVWAYSVQDGVALCTVTGSQYFPLIISDGAGYAECDEGNATVVWYGTQAGFVVKQQSIELSKALRVKKGNPPQLCTVAKACCAGQTDEYFIGTLGDSGFDVREELSANVFTVETIKEEKKPVSSSGEQIEPAPRSLSDWSDASTPEYPRISALLFPETKSWAIVSAMKAADSTYLRANEGRLRAAYLSTDFGKGDREHGHDCSVIERLFDTGFGFPKGFYVHDANLDGREDVIYSGDAKVVEGHWTMVWFGTDSGFVMREGTIQHVLALRMKEGDPPQFSSVEVGCCDDPIDGYFVGTLVDARANLKSVVSYTRFPSRAEKPAGVVGSAGMSLRYSPELEDGYAGPGTTHVGDPAYGNILSVCGTQRTGTIVGRETDKSSRLWYFVVLDEACTDPLRVNVGWVEAGAVSLKK